MSTISKSSSIPQSLLPTGWSFADLQRHLGNVPAHRIRLDPPPGYATENDVTQIEQSEDRLFELENGVLVEKAMGWYESIVACQIILEIGIYLRSHDLGQVLGADGSFRMLPGVIKIPDVSFVSWSRFPPEKLARRPVPELVPDLAVEILSESNTPEEMARKLMCYFEAGVRLVWYVDPASRTATCYTATDQSVSIPQSGELDGGEVLPGFRLSLAWLFNQADRQSPK
jgi:Uma2 family endonuclease